MTNGRVHSQTRYMGPYFCTQSIVVIFKKSALEKKTKNILDDSIITT